MFTDFSSYSKQPKLIGSFGALPASMEGLTGGGIGYRAEGGLREGEQGASWQNPDGTTSSLVQSADFASKYDSASEPENPSDPSDPNPPPRPPDRPTRRRQTEEEARNQRIRENQERSQRQADERRRQQEDRRQAQKESGKSSGRSGGGGGGGGGRTMPAPPKTPPDQKGLPDHTDFSGKPTKSPIDMYYGDGNRVQPSKGTGQGITEGAGYKSPIDMYYGSGNRIGGNFAPSKNIPSPVQVNRDGSTTITFRDGTSITQKQIQGDTMSSNFTLQATPAYRGQSGSNPATYPAVGTTTPITPSGASAWVTDYNSVGFMKNDPIMGGSYSAPSSGNFNTAQGTNPASQVGIAYPSQQVNYDTFSNVTGAGMNASSGAPSFGGSTGQYVNATSNTIANPNTLPTTLSSWDLFGTAGASSGLFLDTPTIKQNGVATTPEVDAEVSPEPAQGGGLGLVAIGLIALKALSVI